MEIEGRILYHAKTARSERTGGVRRLRRSRIGEEGDGRREGGGSRSRKVMHGS